MDDIGLVKEIKDASKEVEILKIRVACCEEGIKGLTSTYSSLEQQIQKLDIRLSQVETKINNIESLLISNQLIIKEMHDSVDLFIGKHRLDALKIIIYGTIEIIGLGTVITILQFLK